MTSKMQIIGLLFLFYLIKFLMNFYEILENNRINISQQFFKKFNFFKKEIGFVDFFPMFQNFFFFA